MKNALLLLTGLALSCGAFAQDMYLEYKLSGPANGTSKMYTSTAGVRVEAEMQLPQMGSMKSVTLMPASKPGTVITFTDKAKTYTEIKTQSNAAETAKYEVKVVGKEKIGAYNCVHSTVSLNGKPAMEMWTSKEIPGYETLLKQTKANSPIGTESMYRQLESKGASGMMVKMTVGTGGMTTELVKAEKRSNPASLFAVPAGYTKSEFDPAQMQNMTPAQRQKMMQEMMKQYGSQPKKP